MKVGDKVSVISVDHAECEIGGNYIKREKHNISVGDVFTISRLRFNKWLRLEGLDFWHPIEKFKLVKDNSNLLTTTEAITLAIDNMALNETFSYHDLIKKIRKMPLKNPTVYESSIERIFRMGRLNCKYKIKSEHIEGTNRTRFRKIN